MRAKYKKPKRLQNKILLFPELYISGSTNPILQVETPLSIILGKTNLIFQGVSKSIMAAQKLKKNLAKIFGIFECLWTQNPTKQDSKLSWFFQAIWKTVIKSKKMGLQGIISAWTCSTVNCRKSLKNRNLWFLEFYFYLKYISNKDDIWQGRNFTWSVIRRKKT